MTVTPRQGSVSGLDRASMSVRVETDGQATASRVLTLTSASATLVKTAASASSPDVPLAASRIAPHAKQVLATILALQSMHIDANAHQVTQTGCAQMAGTHSRLHQLLLYTSLLAQSLEEVTVTSI